MQLNDVLTLTERQRTMKNTITGSEFIDSFDKMGRGDSFSYKGFQSLYEYLTIMEEATGEEIELDVVAIDCDFAEYGSALEAAEDFGWDTDDEDADDEETEAGALEFLKANTTVIIEGEGFIIIKGW